jgi:putative transposase
LLAVAPNEVWSWDITKLKGPAKWTYFYLYVILDIFSRRGQQLGYAASLPPTISVIAPTSEKQEKYNDNKNGRHSFLQ